MHMPPASLGGGSSLAVSCSLLLFPPLPPRSVIGEMLLRGPLLLLPLWLSAAAGLGVPGCRIRVTAKGLELGKELSRAGGGSGPGGGPVPAARCLHAQPSLLPAFWAAGQGTERERSVSQGRGRWAPFARQQ